MPVVGDTHELQTGRNASRDWFLATAVKVKPDIAGGSTAQGKYVVGPDGKAYGFNNNRSIERVNQMLDSALAKYKSDPPIRVDFKDVSAPPSGIAWPDGVLTVRVATRIRPLPEGCDPMNTNVGIDHLWILQDERTEMAAGRFPAALLQRITRFNMVDNVRGEPDMWRENEITAQTIVEKGTGIWHVTFAASGGNPFRSVDGWLEIDASAGFLAYGEAKAKGRSTYTPGEPEGSFTLVFGMKKVVDPTSKTVPPQAITYGREYFQPQD